MSRGSSGRFAGVRCAQRGATLAALTALAVACGRSEKSDADGARASTAGSASGSALTAATGERNAGSIGTAASPTSRVSPTPPASFEAAKSVVLVRSDAAGCTGRQLDGWVQVTCDAETKGRGRLVQADVKEGGVGGEARLAPQPDGQLQFVLPWQRGKRALVGLEFAKAKFELAVNNAGGGFRRVLPKAQAETCDALARETNDRIAKLREAKVGPVRALDVKRFPRLGACEVEGEHAWALEVADIRAAGDSVEREVSLTLNVVHVDAAGKKQKTAWGPVAFAPGKLAMADVSVFDYDGDDVPEVILRHDVLARGELGARKPPAKLPMVFTFDNGRVVPYAPAGVAPLGGTAAEQLENDGRPDLGDYGPYLAWLGLNCGVGKCPERIVGPRFYRRSLPGGGFDANATEATASLQRACSRNPGGLVSDVETVGGKNRTALNVACARLRGESTETVLTALNQAKSQICGDASGCQLLSVLTDWAKARPPRNLVLPGKE